MALDRALEAALERAAEEFGQPRSVAQRLQAWLSALADGDDSEETKARRFDELLETLKGEATDAD